MRRRQVHPWSGSAGISLITTYAYPVFPNDTRLHSCPTLVPLGFSKLNICWRQLPPPPLHAFAAGEVGSAWVPITGRDFAGGG